MDPTVWWSFSKCFQALFGPALCPRLTLACTPLAFGGLHLLSSNWRTGGQRARAGSPVPKTAPHWAQVTPRALLPPGPKVVTVSFLLAPGPLLGPSLISVMLGDVLCPSVSSCPVSQLVSSDVLASSASVCARVIQESSLCAQTADTPLCLSKDLFIKNTYSRL